MLPEKAFWVWYKHLNGSKEDVNSGYLKRAKYSNTLQVLIKTQKARENFEGTCEIDNYERNRKH